LTDISKDIKMLNFC